MGASPLCIRVASCSLDRSVVLFDVHANSQLARIGLPHPLECITFSLSEDFLFGGAVNGTIFSIDISGTASSFTHAHAQSKSLSQSRTEERGLGGFGRGAVPAADRLAEGVAAFVGHSKSILGLALSLDGSSLVSISEDGSMRVWDIWTRQCIRELKPLNKLPVTNILVKTIQSCHCMHGEVKGNDVMALF